MTRKEDIFFNFINNEILKEKYNILETDIPYSLEQGLYSDNVVIKAIAIIVSSTEVSKPPLSDKQLYTQLSQFLNETAL